MALFLVRHDKTKAEGLCYGRTDVELAIAPNITALRLKPQLPDNAHQVFSSPLQRCALLAVACYPDQCVHFESRLQEVHFGDWEETPWHLIDRTAIDRWALAPTEMQFPNGESLDEFRTRLNSIWLQLATLSGHTVVFTHAGVIRYFLAQHLNQPWLTLLDYPVGYGSITVIN